MEKITKSKKIITILLLLFLPLITFSKNKSDKHYILLIRNKVLKSDSDKKNWRRLKNKLKENIQITDIHFSKNSIYVITDNSGIYFADSKMNEWKNISSEKFRRKSIYLKNPGYRKISAFCVDQKKPGHLVAATKHTIYETYNNGTEWIERKPDKNFSKKYITALEIDKNSIYIGTSFNGIYNYSNNRIRSLNKGLPGEPYSKSFKFYDEIIKIISVDKMLYAITGLNGKLLNYRNERWKEIKITEDKINDISRSSENIVLSTKNTFYYVNSLNKIIKTQNIKNNGFSLFSDEEAVLHLKADKKNILINKKTSINKKNNNSGYYALYAPVNTIKTKKKNIIKTIKSCGFNSIVIDMKDDNGRLHYNSSNKKALEIKSIARNPLHIKNILREFKKNNIYCIARIVVFKDKILFNAYNSKHAIKNIKTGKPWKGLPMEYWVDPYSTDVHEYNLEIALELEKLGFDEIQFDYIRFPIDGPVWQCFYSHKKNKDSYKSEILCDFLIRAKSRIRIPVSVDIYGFNSWYRFGNTIGQDMEEFSKIVDIICPMVYPSHFGRKFYMNGNRKQRSYKIIKDGGIRARYITGYKTIIRPYLQAFKMMSPTWGTGYIKNQIKGAEDSGCNGLTFWNARGDYKILIDSLSKNE